ncbi:MBL fold metallo-hydrolase [Noviherbaspirillum massiliense]|uniref:MBL fold metallo-hydrolase n=1 Tax=Noviherbaspirillum massiliense TaxID=1465823 RepID=UPI00037DDF45|nr:MBL fold metallo-hydrolase [Noviherbaspirillum massiliense]
MKLPSIMRVFERGWLSSNNILFLGREQTALVDSGYLTHAPQTVALVSHALQGRPLDLLVNTHLHSDHCGGNATLQRTFSCRTLIPAAEADKVRAWDEDALSYKATGQQCERFGFDGTIAPGDTLTLGDLHWQALAAPGHDPHSLILYCPEERILISADALWENGFGVVFPELAGEPGFAEVRATLELIAGLDVKLVIPGHGAPFTDVDKALATAFSRIDYFEADPVRNAQNAIKVLLKFLLLERQDIPLPQVEPLLSGLPLVHETNRRYLNKSVAELAEWAVAQLVRAGAAEVACDRLMNKN